ncbi:GAP family protein [Enteractinococcus helveticum]|uniref:Sap-like sulfolipid-1-addressing protein n=1 Tax=Enteractinococcus helveticum TaxID=1837282 RepID=A0A1B7LXN0_9MICC|nr:GAP family protein [Enteractinococcus helveticum]OAV59948.1 hypothetical protein A6F49_14490 [Enteractinococcus helveticum]
MDIEIVTSFAVLFPVLAGLALVDSLSFGTLAIPVWLLMAPGRLRVGRILVYLASICGFYFLVGLVLLFGARFVSSQVQIDWSHPGMMLLGFVFGLGLLVLSFVMDPPKSWHKAGPKEKTQNRGRMASRMIAWRQSMVQETVTPSADHPSVMVKSHYRSKGKNLNLMGLAATAGLLEVATMLPYLAAVGLLTASAPTLGLGSVQSAGVLAGYCVVMVLPMLILLLGRVLFQKAVTPLLQRVDAWFAEKGQSTIAWAIGIVGVVLMLNTWPVAQELLPGTNLG